MNILNKLKAKIYKKIIMPFGNRFLIPYFKHSKVILYSNQHSGTTPPHTISIIKQKNKYLGFVGPQGNGNIDLFFSKNLIDWVPFKANPIIKEKGCRWPSALKVGNYIYMFHTANFCTEKPANIVLKRAKINQPDKFEFVKQVTFKEEGYKDKYNPFIFYDKKNKLYYLYFHTISDKKVAEIRVKYSKNILNLDKAKEEIICSREEKRDGDSKRGLAAPSMMYIDGYYILQVETKIKRKWIIEAYISKYPDKLFRPIKKPLLEHDQACPFPYIEGNKIYNFIAESGGIRILDSAGIEALWNPWFLGLVVYDKNKFLNILDKLNR